MNERENRTTQTHSASRSISKRRDARLVANVVCVCLSAEFTLILGACIYKAHINFYLDIKFGSFGLFRFSFSFCRCVCKRVLFIAMNVYNTLLLC